jgi:shikimate kinase
LKLFSRIPPERGPVRGLAKTRQAEFSAMPPAFSPQRTPQPDKAPGSGCVSIIGMAAAGKTTIGRELAVLLDCPQLDTDQLIEATYGARLQAICSVLGKEAFLDVEAQVIGRLRANRMIISTGGSVVYRANSMAHLRALGPLIYIAVPLPVIQERIRRKPDRGLAINPGQTVEDLFLERKRLYETFATFTVEGGDAPPRVYAARIADWLSKQRAS